MNWDGQYLEEAEERHDEVNPYDYQLAQLRHSARLLTDRAARLMLC